MSPLHTRDVLVYCQEFLTGHSVNIGDFLREAAALNSSLKGALAFDKGGTQTAISGRHYRVCFGLREDTKHFNSCFPGKVMHTA